MGQTSSTNPTPATVSTGMLRRVFQHSPTTLRDSDADGASLATLRVRVAYAAITPVVT